MCNSYFSGLGYAQFFGHFQPQYAYELQAYKEKVYWKQHFYAWKFGRLVCRANDKNKIKTAESDISESLQVWAKTQNYTPLLKTSIHCESKMQKQDLQAEESWWQNFNSTTNYYPWQKLWEKLLFGSNFVSPSFPS